MSWRTSPIWLWSRIFDFAKMGHPAILHFGFRAILQYISTSSTTTTTTTTTTYEYPTPGDTKVIGTILSIAQQLDTTGTILHLSNNQEGASNNAEQKEFSSSVAVLSPICAALGGSVGQVILKACSKKFTPHCWLFIDWCGWNVARYGIVEWFIVDPRIVSFRG